MSHLSQSSIDIDHRSMVNSRRRRTHSKRVAIGDFSALHASSEPARSLLRRSMSEGFGYHVTPRLHLKPIVTDRRCRVQRFVNVTTLQKTFHLGLLSRFRLICPDTCEAIGLQFQAH